MSRQMILVVDHHPVAARGLAAILSQRHFVSDVVYSIEDARSSILTSTATYLMCELDLEGSLDLPGYLKSHQLPIKTLYFSSNRNPSLLDRARRVGGVGALDKQSSGDDILAAIEHVERDGHCWSRQLVRKIVGAMSANRVEFGRQTALTQREHHVLQLICSGLSNRKIAVRLEISYETVKEHVQNVLRKLHVSDRTQAAIWLARTEMAQSHQIS